MFLVEILKTLSFVDEDFFFGKLTWRGITVSVFWVETLHEERGTVSVFFQKNMVW